MVYITSALWSLRHRVINQGADLGASTFPTSTEFAEWLAWASGLVNTYVHSTSDITDDGVTIRNIVDALLWLKYLHELQSKGLTNYGLDLQNAVRVPFTLDGTVWAQQLDAMYANKEERPTARCYSLLDGRRVI